MTINIDLDLEELKNVVNELNQKHPRPNLNLEVLGLVNIFKENYITCGEMAGVYVVFNMERKIIYVGKAPGTYNGRLIKMNRIQKNSQSEGFHFVEDSFISNEAQYFAFIPIPVDIAFEGASIEEFIVRKIKPRLNKYKANDVVIIY